MGNNCDFSGYATRNDLLCADGRTIRRNAFKENDGKTVPLVWNHDHTNPDAVLGHALLENRDDGVYAYCTFNDSDSGQQAKKLVMHGDVRSLSIWANRLKQIGNDVVHGMIRELSLVLAGANPGATIDFVMAHSDEGEACSELYANYDESALVLYHSDEKSTKGDTEDVANEIKKTEQKEETIADVFDTLTDKQKEVVYAMIGQALADAAQDESDEEEEVQHSDEEVEEEIIEHADEEESEDEESEDEDDETVAEVFDTLSDKQKEVVYAMIGQAIEDNEINHSEGGDEIMKTNLFDQEVQNTEVLSHAEMTEIFEDAKRCGSLKEAVLAHGIEQIGELFPDHKALNGEPEFIKRNDDWVAKVLGGVHHSPFSRVKSVFADVTGNDARAKGYVKGNLKVEEVFRLFKRVTNPTTVYKKQKLDRDDVLDIKDFNIIPWLKSELRMMLDEELARAFLVGDGRNPVTEADDKINEECIRPIWKMEDLFTVKVAVEVSADATAEDKAKAFIKACIKSRKNYKGSGTPTMFMSEDMLTDCLLIEDSTGRTIYDSVAKLASVLRVKEIVPVPVMEGLTRDGESGMTLALAGIYVNLQDYNVGTDKGGEINMFDDFDIDYNQYKYLMETRCSGSLVKPQSAVAIEFATK